MSKRRSLSKTVRFEVFKRDSFTCQYCGGKAPDVVLHVDHIKAVSSGGDNALLNLVTSCVACNLGKSNKSLSDASAVSASRKQAESMQERRQQIEMMAEWHAQLSELDDYQTEVAVQHWATVAPGFTPNSKGKRILADAIKRFSLTEVLEAMDISGRQYIRWNGDVVTQESWENGLAKITGICKGRKMERENPERAMALTCRNIARKRIFYGSESYSKEQRLLHAIESALQRGVDGEDVKHVCLSAGTLNQLEDALGDLE